MEVGPRAIAPERGLAIVELRRRRLTQARIARSLAVLDSTVSRVVSRAGPSRWRDLMPSPCVRREHRHPGDLVHLDTMNRPGFSRRSPGLSQTAIGS